MFGFILCLVITMVFVIAGCAGGNNMFGFILWLVIAIVSLIAGCVCAHYYGLDK